MIRLLVVATSCVGLILFVSFIATRLIRSRSRGLSVRMQVFLALALIVGAFAFGLGLLVIDRVEARAQRLALAAADDESRAIAAILHSEMARTGANFEVLATQLETWKPRTGGQRSAIGSVGLELLGPSGNVLYPGGTRSRADEPGAVSVDAPLRDRGELVGTVRVVKPTIVIQALLADFAPTVLAISLVLGAAAAIAAAWIGRTIAAPIETLSEYAEHVSAGERMDLPKRVTGREVGRLVQSIDIMRRRLEGRPFVETFAADLSHELKNPVAAIRASAEVLEDGALDEPEQARRFVRRIREAASRIERLLAELLSLARVETRGAEELDRIDLSQVVIAAIREASAGDRITWNRAQRLWVRGDERWLSRAMENLVQNAVLHSEKGSAITIQLLRQRDDVVVRVENAGAISPHVEKSMFRRFVTTRQDKGGTGLGLPIARAVAEAHSGRLELLQAGPPHVVFELRLPRA